MSHDNLPKKNPIWLLFDIDNGHSRSHHYVWWFETRKLAREFKEHHLQQRANGKSRTDLVGPVRATVDKIPKGAFEGTRLEQAPKGICFRILDRLTPLKRCVLDAGHSGYCSATVPKKDKPKGLCYMQIDLVGQGTTRRCLKPKNHKGPCSPYAS